MAYSYQTTIVSSATTGPFYFTDIDGYLDISHIKVYVNGALQTTGYTINQVAKSVTFASTQAVSSVIRIERQTPKTVAGRVTDFNDGSVLTAQDLDNAALQNLYISQEAQDAGVNALPLTGDGLQWDASNKRITNLAYPIDPSDAVTKLYLDGYSLSGTAWTVPQSWSFTGNGSQTVFAWLTGGGPVPATTDSAMFIVEAGGVIQRPEIDYTINAANITFLSVPANGVGIRIRNFGVSRDIPVWGDPITFSGLITANGGITTSGNISLAGFEVGNMSSGNVFVGEVPVSSAASQRNVGIGIETLGTLTSGTDCVAVGYSACSEASTGSKNTGVGSDSYVGLTGSQNTSVGYKAGYNASAANPTQSIYLGSDTQSSGSVTNEIVIGYGATGEGSNTTVIGNASTTQTKTRGNLVSTGAITSSSGNITASSGGLSCSGLLTVSGTGTSSIAGTLSVPSISGLTSLSASSLSGTSVTGGTVTATTSLVSNGTLTVGSAVMATPSGTAPMFMPRAWVNYQASQSGVTNGRVLKTMSWSISGATGGNNIMTVTLANHGLKAGHRFYGTMTGDYSETRMYSVIAVTSSSTFTAQHTSTYVSGTWTGSIATEQYTIRSSGNVDSVWLGGTGVQIINLTSAMPNTNYCVIGTTAGTGSAGTCTPELCASLLTEAVSSLAGSATANYLVKTTNSFAVASISNVTSAGSYENAFSANVLVFA